MKVAVILWQIVACGQLSYCCRSRGGVLIRRGSKFFSDSSTLLVLNNQQIQKSTPWGSKLKGVAIFESPTVRGEGVTLTSNRRVRLLLSSPSETLPKH